MVVGFTNIRLSISPDDPVPPADVTNGVRVFVVTSHASMFSPTVLLTYAMVSARAVPSHRRVNAAIASPALQRPREIPILREVFMKNPCPFYHSSTCFRNK